MCAKARRIPLRVGSQRRLDGCEERRLLLARRACARTGSIALGARAEMQQQRRIAAVIEDHVGVAAVGPLEDPVGVVPVLGQRLALVGEHGVPRAAMAAAAWSWVEKMLHEAQRTSAPSACRVSISTAVWMVMCSEPAMRAPSQRLGRRKLLADRHQPGHLGLGDQDFLATPVGEREVGDLRISLAIAGGGRFECGVHGRSPMT